VPRDEQNSYYPYLQCSTMSSKTTTTQIFESMEASDVIETKIAFLKVFFKIFLNSSVITQLLWMLYQRFDLSSSLVIRSVKA
jgi:hypothetical protein